MNTPHTSTPPACIDLRDIRFRWKPSNPPALELDRFTVAHGEHVFVEGPSGSGKSTLLSLLAGIVTPDQGTVELLGHRLNALSGPKRDQFRADHMGYIFQLFNLVPYLSILENVTLPCHFSAKRKRQAADPRAEAERLLDHLGLSDPRLKTRPVTELSVGQQQRVAAARALIGSPEILIADEPTSSLDQAHREAFLSLLFQECATRKTTVVFVSHDTTLAPAFDRTVRLDPAIAEAPP